jgi:Homeodomain-like domain
MNLPSRLNSPLPRRLWRRLHIHTPPGLGKIGKNCELDEEQGLTDVQFRAIKLILSGRTDKEISAELDVSRKTLWVWKRRHPPFRAALASFRAQLRDAFSDRCQNQLVSAGNALEQMMNESLDEKVRLRAAEVLFRSGGQYLYRKPSVVKSCKLRVASESK